MKVRCNVNHYCALSRGAVYDVICVDPYGNYVIENERSPHGTSSYSRCNFSIVEEKPMLHIAFPLLRPDQPVSWDNINTAGERIRADSADELKARIRAEITKDPNSRWVIFSANTIAEISQPPVRFRSL